jgi:hypothetical protein
MGARGAAQPKRRFPARAEDEVRSLMLLAQNNERSARAEPAWREEVTQGKLCRGCL